MPQQLVTGGLVLDTDTKEVTVDGDPVRLTAREYKILEYLMHNIGRVLSSAQIYEAVWNEPAYGTEKTVTVHIRNIREKIEINPKEPKYLKVVYGLGYKVEKCYRKQMVAKACRNWCGVSVTPAPAGQGTR